MNKPHGIFSVRKISKIRYFILLLLFTSLSAPLLAQDDIFSDNPLVSDPFRASILVNTQTTVMPAKTGWQFHIRHRFGAIKTDNSIVKNFLGTDLVANIRFSFVFPLGEKTCFGVGRSKNGKTYDLEAKRIILTQTTDNHVPVTVAAYVDAACMSDAFVPVSKNAYFGDGVTPFENKFLHRLSYNSQLIISRKFSKRISAELVPSYMYHNLVVPGNDNYTLNLTAGIAIRTTLNASFIAEYGYRFNNEPTTKNYPLSIGYEFGTPGHAFQIVVSSARDILEQQIYSTECTNYPKGEFVIGFNLKRSFWYKKYKKDAAPIQ